MTEFVWIIDLLNDLESFSAMNGFRHLERSLGDAKAAYETDIQNFEDASISKEVTVELIRSDA